MKVGKKKIEIERFIAIDENGNKYTVICWQNVIDTSTLDGKSEILGLKEWITESGLRVNQINPETFQIVTTDQIIRKVS